jgi:hypothetical protein
VKAATVTKTEVWLQRASDVGPATAQDFDLLLHKMKTRPNVLPSNYQDVDPVASGTIITSFCTLKPGQSGWFTIPNSPTNWGQLIANGTHFGVATVTYYTPPYKACIGIDYPNDPTRRNAQSGALRITYKRS